MVAAVISGIIRGQDMESNIQQGLLAAQLSLASTHAVPPSISAESIRLNMEARTGLAPVHINTIKVQWSSTLSDENQNHLTTTDCLSLRFYIEIYCFYFRGIFFSFNSYWYSMVLKHLINFCKKIVNRNNDNILPNYRCFTVLCCASRKWTNNSKILIPLNRTIVSYDDLFLVMCPNKYTYSRYCCRIEFVIFRFYNNNYFHKYRDIKKKYHRTLCY